METEPEKLFSKESIYLINKVNHSPIPLTKIKIKAFVEQFIIKFRITQYYNNILDESIETLFIFPIDSDTCISKITLSYENGEIIETIIDEKEKINVKYEEAVKEGKTAIKGSYPVSFAVDLFKLTLGCFPPKCKAKIKLETYQHMTYEDYSYCFRVPMRYIPRYIGNPNILLTYYPEETKKIIEEQLPLLYSLDGKSPYSWNLKINLKTKGELIRVQSKNHAISFEQMSSNNGLITLKEEDFKSTPKNDFVLLVNDSNFGNPSLLVGSAHGDQSFLITMYPDFRTKKQKDQVLQMVDKNGILQKSDFNFTEAFKEQETSNFETEKCEYIFLLDRSGSMFGSRIILAIEALKLFLYSLPAGCYFNIYSFGSEFQLLHEKSVPYQDDTLSQSIMQISKFDANMGGTEILKPLNAIFKSKPPKNFTRQIFLLTDGAVYNIAQVVNLVKTNSNNKLRVHTFGVGAGASTDLVKNTAIEGGGMYYFLQDAKEIELNVIDALSITLIPYLVIQEIQIYNHKNKKIYSKELGLSIPNGRLFNFSDILLNSEEDIGHAILVIQNPNLGKQSKIKIQAQQNVDGVMQIAFGKYLKEQFYRVNQSEKYKLVEISKKHQVLFQGTSFFASKQIIDEETKEKKRIKIPISNQNIVNITVKTVTGKSIFLEDINVNLKVEELKQMIYETENIPIDQQRMIFAGKQMEDNRMLGDYNVPTECQIHLVLRLRGGGYSLTMKDGKQKQIIQKDAFFYLTEQTTARDILHQAIGKRKQNDYKVFGILKDETFEFTDLDELVFKQSTREMVSDFIISQIISVEIGSTGCYNYTQKRVFFQDDMDMNCVLEQLGIQPEGIKIYVNNTEFKSPKNMVFKDLGIRNDGIIRIEIQNFKSIVYLQNAEGFWDEKILQILGTSEKDLRLKQINNSKFETIILFTLAGIKWLRTNYIAQKQYWKLIERKALLFLKKQMKIEQNQVEKQVEEFNL